MKNYKYILPALLLPLLFWGCEKNLASDPSAAGGVGGSMARFAIADDHMYVVDRNDLQVFDITTPNDPTFLGKTTIGNGVETIFPYDGRLFIGTQTGMQIYSIADPVNPVYVSDFAHVLSCDPVIANESHAFVTLRGGNFCGWSLSQLDILDIADIENPQLVSTLPQVEPYGLALHQANLYVCNGDSGVQVINVFDPTMPFEIGWLDSLHGYDAIVSGDLLLIVGEDGLFQYDLSTNPDQPTLLSQIGN